MSELHLSQRERALVVDALEDYLSDLRMEISDTDRQDYRDMLKEKKEALRKVLFAVQTS